MGEVTVTELSPAVTMTSEAVGLDGSIWCRISHPRHCWHLDQTAVSAVGLSSTLQDTEQHSRLFPLHTDRNPPSSQGVITKTDPHCPRPLEGILAPLRTTGLKMVMLSEVRSDQERQVISYDITYMWHLKNWYGNSLAVQWLGPRAFTAEGLGSIPGQGTKIPQAVQHSKNK